MRQTDQQIEIMNVIFAAIDRGEELTTRMLINRLSYGRRVYKQSIIQSLQVLEKHGMITKQYRGCKPMILMPTRTAYVVLRPTPADL